MLLYIKGKEHGKLLYDSVINGPFKNETVEVPETQTTPASVRDRTYDDLTEPEKIRKAYDIRATNIVIQGLPQDIYNLTQYHQQLSLNAQQYYSPSAQPQRNDVPMVLQRAYQAPIANQSSVVHHQSYQTPSIHQQPQALFLQLDSGLVVPSFIPSDYRIASLNKAMAFISTTFASCYPPTNNQLSTLSNPRNQATIQDGRVMVQMVQGRQTQGYAVSGARGSATCIRMNINVGTNTIGQAKVIRFYNCQEEGHMARQCTKTKRPRNSPWFKEKMLLAEALESGVVLDEEQIEFLANNRDIVTTGQTSQEVTTISIFQTDNLDIFDFDYDGAPSASVIFMAKLSAYDSEVFLKVPTHDTYIENHMTDQSVQEMQYSEQLPFNNETDFDITSGNTVISYEQYLKETENAVVQDTKSSAQQDAMIMSAIEEMFSQVAKRNEGNKENKISTTVDVLKKECKAKKDKYLDEIIDLEKKKKSLDNVI
ncbi:retrovirus-related pol polyprotein from transposon TNT 1-94 [Tanacetum coccineum]